MGWGITESSIACLMERLCESPGALESGSMSREISAERTRLWMLDIHQLND